MLTTATSAAVALALNGDWLSHVSITLGIGIGIGVGLAAVNWAPYWMWELLVRADATNQASVRAAAARERNRFGRDVHDVLGHDLTVIALKAELAAARQPPIRRRRPGKPRRSGHWPRLRWAGCGAH